MPIKKERSVLRLLGYLALPMVAAAALVLTRCTPPSNTHIQIADDSVHAKQVVFPAGRVTLAVDNVGTMAHELVVLRTDLPPSGLRMRQEENRVDEAASGQVVGEVEDIAPGQSKPLQLTLSAGHYVLFCNLEGHYQRGVRLGITVQ